MAFVATPAGVSGAFLLLPLQVSLLGVVTPSASSTNLIFNIVSTPGAIWRYRRQGQASRLLVVPVVLGTLPGVVVGAWLRVTVFAPQERFEVFAAVVLAVLGVRLLWRVQTASASRPRVNNRATRLVVFGVALVVGVAGGVYGIGGAALIAPFLVGVIGFRLQEVVGASLIATFLTSVVGVATFAVLARTANPGAAPDWTFGISAGLGGLIGSYAGARLHQHLPARLIQVGFAILVLGLAAHYVT